MSRFKNYIPSKKIGRSYHGMLALRIDEKQIKHTRLVFSFEEFLGSIGGVYRVLISIGFFIFGKFIKMHSKLRWIKDMYRFTYKWKSGTPPGQKKTQDPHNLQNRYFKAKNYVALSRYNKCKHFIMEETFCRVCCKHIWKTNEEIIFQKIMTKGKH